MWFLHAKDYRSGYSVLGGRETRSKKEITGIHLQMLSTTKTDG